MDNEEKQGDPFQSKYRLLGNQNNKCDACVLRRLAANILKQRVFVLKIRASVLMCLFFTKFSQSVTDGDCDGGISHCVLVGVSHNNVRVSS